MSKKPTQDFHERGLTIGELSRRTGVHIETIRYYERIGLIASPPRTSGGRRNYGVSNVRTLASVRRAREIGFSLDEIRALLDLGGPGIATCADVCAIATHHLSTIRAKIADLKKLERFLSDRVMQCSGGAVPDCAVLDALYPLDSEARTDASI